MVRTRMMAMQKMTTTMMTKRDRTIYCSETTTRNITTVYSTLVRFKAIRVAGTLMFC